ncbi:hypothetical protein PCASD_18099 [Puccinia coronata f. sp. avenae]|uniref:Uncharacterized protein n=1 Tax=Puccinia coronata f. sp. avenae TaxID=200324 RepID=A0A2N5T999_9BASI|nr:hypothetical protein PCASD_18099 [Puccinia coronata f. sp. avenae]
MVRKPSSSSTTTGRPRSSLLRGTGSSLWYGRRALAINPRPLWAWAERDGIGGPKGPDAKHHPVPNKGLTLRAAVPPARLLLYVKMIPKASILEFPITPH